MKRQEHNRVACALGIRPKQLTNRSEVSETCGHPLKLVELYRPCLKLEGKCFCLFVGIV